MKIGFAKIDITPPLQARLCGQLAPVKAQGIESPLYATALCLDDGARKVALVSCDILLVPNALAREVAEASPVDEVVVCATHTHSGPETVELFGGGADKQYLASLKRGIILSIETAVASLREGELFHAKGSLEGYAFNRRFLMSGGTVETHPLKGNPRVVKPEGPDSKDIDVLFAKNDGGKLLGGVVVFGCHATVMERDNALVSADFPGKTTQFLADELGVPFLYLQGACGDICQVNPLDTTRHEVGKDWAAAMGKAVGTKAMELMKSQPVKLDGPLKVMTSTIELPRREIPPDLRQWAERHQVTGAEAPTLSDYGNEWYGRLPDGKLSLEELFATPFWADFYATEIKIRGRDYQRCPTMRFDIKTLALGGVALVTLPCELFVEWQDRIKAASPFERTVVVELANGWNGYIPTREAFSRPGGYETKEVTSTMLVPEAGDMVFSAVMDTLRTKRILFFGDSIAVGVGASRPAKRFSSMLVAKLGQVWQEINLGVSGSTLASAGYHDVLPKALAEKPDVFVIQYGVNDNALATPVGEFLALYRGTVLAAKKELPAAVIVCVTICPSWSHYQSSPEWLEAANAGIKDIAATEGALVALNYEKMENRRDLFPDGIHPNDGGHLIMAEAIFETLKGDGR